MVRTTNNFARNFKNLLPSSIQQGINNRFDQTEYRKQQAALGKEAPYFDMIRASVNLVVASILISFATSLKLPLSTTYVTFMVAMGTSLSDKAWGRESAVYRITGVFSVIGGWFFTAFSAFMVAFLVAIAIKYGGFVAVMILIGLAVFFVYRTHVIHKRRYAASEEAESVANEVISGSKIAKKSSLDVIQIISKISEIMSHTISGLADENLRKLRKSYKEVEAINKKTKALKQRLSDTIEHLEENSIDTGHYYVQVLDYLREIAHSITFITKPSFDHVDNNHKPLIDAQIEEFYDMTRMIKDLISGINESLKSSDYSNINDIIGKQQKILKFIGTLQKKQVKRIKANEVGTRNSMLFLGILTESKNLVLQLLNLLKSHRDFTNVANGNAVPEED
jgi:Na+/phosphate symporter